MHVRKETSSASAIKWRSRGLLQHHHHHHHHHHASFEVNVNLLFVRSLMAVVAVSFEISDRASENHGVHGDHVPRLGVGGVLSD